MTASATSDIPHNPVLITTGTFLFAIYSRKGILFKSIDATLTKGTFISSTNKSTSSLEICILEKHFTLDKNMEGWDHKISADPEELKIICKANLNHV